MGLAHSDHKRMATALTDDRVLSALATHTSRLSRRMAIAESLFLNQQERLRDLNSDFFDAQERPYKQLASVGIKPSEGGGPYEWRKPPASVAAVCVFLGIEHLYPKLKEALYVYWRRAGLGEYPCSSVVRACMREGAT